MRISKRIYLTILATPWVVNFRNRHICCAITLQESSRLGQKLSLFSMDNSGQIGVRQLGYALWDYFRRTSRQIQKAMNGIFPLPRGVQRQVELMMPLYEAYFAVQAYVDPERAVGAGAGPPGVFRMGSGWG